jgi:CelD/BcsL family acetyltransferase involved in cellulose biosynthesis
MNASVEVERVSREEDFAQLAAEWDELVQAMPRPSPFLLHGWLLAWWRHFGEGAELSVEIARREGRLVAAMPLFVRRRRGLRVAEFLGGHESALADLLLAHGEDRSTSLALLARLASTRPVCDVAYLYGLSAESRLQAALAAHGKPLRLVVRSDAPVLDLTPGWRTVYERKVSAKRRSLHRRRRRQLGELGELRTSIARTPGELADALEDAFRLHTLRWRGRPDLSTFGTERGRRFHRAALAAISPLDVARIVTLTLDGRPIAFHYYMLLKRTMYVHHLAYDPVHGRLSPGLVNTYDAIEAADGEGAVAVEFLGGAERYKAELADRFDPLFEGLGLAGTMRGTAALAARLVALEGRRRLKEWETLRRLYYNPATRVLRRGAN